MQEAYSDAVKGTDWERLYRELAEQADEEINPDDALELYEVEGRPVGVVWPEDGMGCAWVWRGGRWNDAPGLVNKSWSEGSRLSTFKFLVSFPGANLDTLITIAELFLTSQHQKVRSLLSPSPREIPDRPLIEAGYWLTHFLLAQSPIKFPVLSARLLDAMNVSLEQIRPYISGWYNFAREELGEPPGTNTPYEVSQCLLDLQPIWGCHDNSDPYLAYDVALPKVMRTFAEERCRALAKRVRWHLRRMAPSGIFQCSQQKTLWDEYCFQFQQGPPQLEAAWEWTIVPMVDGEIDKLIPSELSLLTFAAMWERDTLEDFEPVPGLISKDEIRWFVRRELDVLADQQRQD
jgi:hypothetical protein